MESLPEGSELLLVIVAVSGVSTWYLSNFTERYVLARIAALIGVSSMLTLVAWVYL
tara:strand:+ start:659 stop:826 length:168 start_codon:yes stop_codon:yes gene_type:complete